MCFEIKVDFDYEKDMMHRIQNYKMMIANEKK